MPPDGGSTRGWWVVAVGVVIGSLTAVQSRANGSLATELGSGLQAATVSFCVGLVLLGVLALAQARMRSALARLASGLRAGTIPWWQLLGGVFGALFIFSQAASVPTIGVALFAVSLVSGMNLASLLVDGVGIGPRGRQPITGYRVASAVIGIVAVATSVSSRLGTGDLVLPLVALCVGAGVGVALQQATNARAVAATGEPLIASYVTFVGGGLILGSILAGTVLTGSGRLTALPPTPLWLYLGGVIGALWVAAAAWVVGRVGVLWLGLLTTAGQLVGALILDLLLTDVVSPNLVVGIVLAFLAVAIAAGPGAWRLRR